VTQIMHEVILNVGMTAWFVLVAYTAYLEIMWRRAMRRFNDRNHL
jgi:hypothetical protein